MSQKLDRTLVFIPTYNERENVTPIVEHILELPIALDLLFVDDNSPDGTGAILDNLSKKHSNIKVIHRSNKNGVGGAHLVGIQYAYDHGYSRLVTMDCDFTHPPKMIIDILNANDRYDVIVGSRYMQEKSLDGWNPLRKLLTHTGHFLTLHLLKIKYDATGGFRFYRLDRIPRETFSLVRTRSYSFFFESLFVLHFNGCSIFEIPIILPPRTYGHSKMSYREAINSLKLLLKLSFVRIAHPESLLLNKKFSDVSQQVEVDKQGWDDYWNTQKDAGGLLYHLIAVFYRKFIIKPNLNRFIKKYFSPQSNLLHAGCGSGQVDLDIRDYASITGMDISVKALEFYTRTNRNHCKALHGSIFQIPIQRQAVDGIYNLGVMEHFTKSEIQQILKEFHRVLKDDGKIVLFWPPEYGLSVLFFKGLKWIFETILRKENVSFHPDEISRIQSKKDAIAQLKAADFTLIEYYFGPKDVFTYSVIVAQKTRESLRSDYTPDFKDKKIPIEIKNHPSMNISPPQPHI